ncbi:MAG: hypothetical protein LQ342_004572 [Letrouitia transgressa]|nr:MAG: hypothetical protein LQ342_004572 [Letrouitia transgressa]
MSAFKSALSKLKHSPKDQEEKPVSRSPNLVTRLHDAISPEITPRTSTSSDVLLNDDGQPMSKNQLRKHAKREDRKERNEVQAARDMEVVNRRKAKETRAAREEPADLFARYGLLPPHQLTVKTESQRASIDSLSSRNISERVTIKARVHAVRKLSSRLAFIVFRKQMTTIQGVLQESIDSVTHHFVQWAEHLPAESVVLVTGVVQNPLHEVTGCSIHDIEIAIQELHLISQVTDSPAFTVYEAQNSRGTPRNGELNDNHLAQRVRLANRIVDLRTPPSLAIFRINSGICNLFRSYLDSQGFIEIHTPKLQGAATESGASVFQVEYFGRPAFLAQSPQLAKQMSIAADFGRVYEIGPVFRAENSNTHRHLTEFTGLDLEMALEKDYHEALDMIDETFKFVFEGIYRRFRREIDAVKTQFPHEDLVWLDKTPRLTFREGIRLLTESGWTDEEGNVLSEYTDLSTRDEIRLGELVKEKYKTDFYILDKFPASARPFYAMPALQNKDFTNSFDIFLRGQEILSGGQRIHDAKSLKEQMLKHRIELDSMEDYLDGFRWGAPPHAGGGIGLERLVMLLLSLGDIRMASLFPRDPRSFPLKAAKPPLHHPEADTLNFASGTSRTEADFPPLEKLIANYGDASNTSWLDDRYHVWRHEDTGAAVGYVPTDGFAITIGEPLCDISQKPKVIRAYLQWLKKSATLKPLWLLVGFSTEEFLGEKLGWRTLSCLAEERARPEGIRDHVDHEVARKVRHAEREGIRLVDLPPGKPVPDSIRQQCDDRIRDWHAHRQGRQVHLTDLKPWRDMEHRRYYYAHDKDKRIQALVVLARLSAEHGFQVKWSLDFPGAPGGTIEHLILHALDAARQAGAKKVTFGASAVDSLTPVHNLHGVRIKTLTRTYHTIATQLKLVQKGEFREKLGAEEDPVYICYPRHGLGAKGIRAIMNFFES